jgi:hypothetical protein
METSAAPTLGGNVTIDEAKTWLTDLREKHCLPKNRFERECGEALDIALWLMEREHKLRKLSDPWLEEWLREYDLEHPCPGS